MSKHLAQDFSVWNRLKYGRCRVPVSEPEEELMSEKAPVSEKSPQSKTPRSGARLILELIVVFFVLLFFLPREFSDLFVCPKLKNLFGEKEVETFARYSGLVDSGSYAGNLFAQKEIFSVAYPFSTRAKPVHSTVLVNHTFDLWGQPALESFKPPKAKFNKVVLTLNTSVDGVQYDRLAHLYVGGAEIWRTSTAEPGGRSVYLTFRKDVSAYAALFGESTDILFQLDNVVTEWLTGKFHVELSADFYYVENGSTTEDFEIYGASPVTKHKYRVFDIRRPADHVYPLVTKSDVKSPPVEYLPSDKFTVKLPQVPRNTTRLKLAVFASGNAAEEFWYNNVLDKYTDRFEKEGQKLLGHGPVRFLNVYVDGEKVAAQTPQPFIFTGGYSPALWSPVVAIDAFDLHSIDIDVTGLLPLLWESGDHVLKLEIGNGVDEFQGSTSGIGRDWITGANLLTYENSEVTQASGHVVHIGQRVRGSAFGVSPPYSGTLQEIVTGILDNQLTSELVFELKNGDLLNTTVSSFTTGEISNAQLYSHLGNSASIVHVGHNAKSFLLTDNGDSDAVIHQVNISLSYPLVLTLLEKKVKGGVDLDVSVVNTKATSLEVNFKRVMAESEAQNGTSSFSIRASGNYGSGALQTKYKVQVHGPHHEFEFKRKVQCAEGEVTSDVEKYKEITDQDWRKHAAEMELLLDMFGKHKGCHGKLYRKLHKVKASKLSKGRHHSGHHSGHK